MRPPRLEHGPLQPLLVARGDLHRERDRLRQRSEDTSAYVNGVLFGFDPDRPLSEQHEGWREAYEPLPEQLAELGFAGRAWLKKEQRQIQREEEEQRQRDVDENEKPRIAVEHKTPPKERKGKRGKSQKIRREL